MHLGWASASYVMTAVIALSMVDATSQLGSIGGR